jgi:hypothetical protein
MDALVEGAEADALTVVDESFAESLERYEVVEPMRQLARALMCGGSEIVVGIYVGKPLSTPRLSPAADWVYGVAQSRHATLLPWRKCITRSPGYTICPQRRHRPLKRAVIHRPPARPGTTGAGPPRPLRRLGSATAIARPMTAPMSAPTSPGTMRCVAVPETARPIHAELPGVQTGGGGVGVVSEW